MSATLSAEAPANAADECHTWPLQPLLDACGLTRTALARRLGLPLGTVKARLSRARRRLRIELAA